MTLTVKRNDTARKIAATLRSNGAAIDLTDADVVMVLKPAAGGSALRKAAVIVDAEAGKIEYQLLTADTLTAASYYLEFEITFNDASVLTVPNTGHYNFVVEEDLG